MPQGKKRVDTDQLFDSLLGKGHEQGDEILAAQPVADQTGKQASAKVGRKAAPEKKQQVSFYLVEDQIIKIDEQTGIKKKERDKSSLARVAIDIVLEMSQAEYEHLTQKAEREGTTPGKIVRAALSAYDS